MHDMLSLMLWDMLLLYYNLLGRLLDDNLLRWLLRRLLLLYDNLLRRLLL